MSANWSPGLRIKRLGSGAVVERRDDDILSRVANRSARLRNELETLEKIHAHLEREIARSAGQGEAGERRMLKKALGQIEENIEKIRDKLDSIGDEWSS